MDTVADQRQARARLCTLALTGLLVLVIAHGIHDAFHEGEVGAAVCIALTLGLAGVRSLPVLVLPVVRLLEIAMPMLHLRAAPVATLARGSPSVQVVPLRL
jgi:hypothetical protein